ncbi:MAG: hypothetical protein LBQ98_01690 [Nitrososphaerota archaeon]|nr:hypothetical protein [Nitrososphaerota archaeon]
MTSVLLPVMYTAANTVTKTPITVWNIDELQTALSDDYTNILIPSDTTVEITSVITIENGVTLTVQGIINNKNVIHNWGTIENWGTINTDNTFYNYPESTINNISGGKINNNYGSTIHNDGTINNNPGSTIHNDGTIHNNKGTLTNNLHSAV